jgi:hypothetical protein
MTDTQKQQTPTPSSQTVTKEDATSALETSVEIVDQFKTKLKAIISSWQVKLGLVITVLISIFIVVFFWQHIVAVWGMKQWSARSGAIPIECMVKDTNDDQYISCSAIRDEQIIPLECGTNILNIGCRVNYGTAASPPVSGRK